MLNVKKTNNLKGENMKTKLCLIATDGDMSKKGMGTKNTVVPFDSAYLKEVKQFLKDQLNLSLESINNFLSNKEDHKKFRKIYNKSIKSFNKLQDLGIMVCKYDFRSTWQLCFNEHDELISYGKYQIEERANV